MKLSLPAKSTEMTYNVIKDHNCYHQYLKINIKTMDKICVSCGTTISHGSLKN
jgi:hypothetical protein